jgi:hypothetical protein
LNPVLKESVLKAEPGDQGHVTVYLPQYNDELILKHPQGIKDISFHLFSKKANSITLKKNIKSIFLPCGPIVPVMKTHP